VGLFAPGARGLDPAEMALMESVRALNWVVEG
jgi:hypothetical protein